MPISIILDKSTFQSLSMEEIFFLQRYYSVTIAPVLLLEILADLKKDKKGFEAETRVVDFAKKILQLNPAFTTNYKQVIHSSLLGAHIHMDGRPLISGGEAVTAPDGKKGFVFKQSPEEKAMHRWRDGQFTEAEEKLAEQWREGTAGRNPLEALKQRFAPNPEINTLQELLTFAETYLNRSEYQSEILVGIVESFAVDYTIAPKVFHRFEQVGSSQVKDFAPYAYYCFKVLLFFELGVINGLLGTRATNQIDLQYLYYLPFCKAFSSKDKFHESTVNFFLEDDQTFISGTELKADIKGICNSRDTLTDIERDQWIQTHKNRPPENPDSITFQIWKKHARPSVFTEEAPREISKEARDKILKKSREYRNSPTDPISQGQFEDSDTDFIIKESWITPEDYCPCGSGKLFKDCHLDEVLRSQQSGS